MGKCVIRKTPEFHGDTESSTNVGGGVEDFINLERLPCVWPVSVCKVCMIATSPCGKPLVLGKCKGQHVNIEVAVITFTA